jgi:acetolactate synthase-1/2/3 large subunit
MTNILTAMAQAHADSIPMLVISSVNKTEQLGMGGGRLHELPSQRNLVSGACAFSHTLMRPDELPEVLSRAFAIFHGARPRPVHIEIPIDVITASADHVPRKLGASPSRPAPYADAVAKAAAILNAAERPALLLGGGACDAGTEALALAEALDAPTALTVNAKGVLPRNHPLSLGSTQSMPPVRELLLNSDAVLAVGTELGETDYDLVFDGNFRVGGSLIRVDIDPEQLNRNLAADVAILSDAGLAMKSLLAVLRKNTRYSASSPGARRVAQARASLEAQWPAAWNGQRRALETLRDALPDVIVAGDSSQPVYSGNFCFEADHPRSWFNSATGYGTLGYGLPAAIGAKLAAPRRPVVALVGDGGLQFTLPELASAVEAGTPIIVVLWNNRGYGEIKRYMVERGIAPIGVDIYTPDFIALAKGFGCDAERASDFEHFRRLLQAGAKSNRPCIIELIEDSGFLTAAPAQGAQSANPDRRSSA